MLLFSPALNGMHKTGGSREGANLTATLHTGNTLPFTSQTVTTGPTLTYNILLEDLYKQDLALDYEHLPFYSNLTMAGMLLTGEVYYLCLISPDSADCVTAK